MSSSINSSKKQPVLLQVLPALGTGGVERGTVDIALAAAKAGFKSVVASQGGHFEQFLKGENVSHVKLPLSSKNPINIYRNIRRLSSLIKEIDADIVHARSRGPAWSAFYAAKKSGRHFITTFHGTYNFDNRFKQRYNSIMAKGDRVIAVSQFINDHIHEHYTPTQDIVRIIHRGVDTNQFDPKHVLPSRLIDLAKKWGIPEDKPIIMLPGRLTRWKGHTLLLEALSEIPTDHFHCLFVGDDQGKHPEYTEALIEKIHALGLSNSVQFVGSTHDMPAAYMLADIIVAPSLEPEAFGRVVTEAQAMERLVVAASHGGACETIIPDKTGWLCKPGDKHSLAHALKHAFDFKPEQRAQMGQYARQHVSEHFSLAQMANKTLSVYNELLAPTKGI